MIYSILIIAALSGCAFFERHEEKPVQADLGELHALWLKEIATEADAETGWTSRTDCDGTLWAGEAYAAGATNVHMELAEHGYGVIHRRPFTACYPDDTNGDGQPDSRSTVSQDMLTGYLWAIWRKKDYAAATRLASYGESRALKVGGATLGWIMGEPYPEQSGEVVMRPNLIGLLGRMLFILTSGEDARSYRTYAPAYLPVTEDYARHIQVLGILLQGEVGARQSDLFAMSIDGEALKRLQEDVAHDPGDALFQTALAIYTGDATEAVRLLRDPAYVCPSYTRGSDINCTVHKAFAASILIAHNVNM